MDLFAHGRQAQIEKESPLANRMRPRTLEEYAGQAHIIGPGRLLRRAIQADQLSSLIFYGPPGTGKTTLARIIANTTRAHFTALNAVLAADTVMIVVPLDTDQCVDGKPTFTDLYLLSAMP